MLPRIYLSPVASTAQSLSLSLPFEQPTTFTSLLCPSPFACLPHSFVSILIEEHQALLAA
jgi:hypothetical protein